MSKSLTDALNKLQASVLEDTGVITFINDTFAVDAPSFVVGADPEAPPSLGDTPAIYVTSAGRTRTDDFRFRVHSFIVWPAFRFDEREDGKTWTSQVALEKLDTLCNLIDAAILPGLQAGGYPVFPSSGGNDTISHPVAIGFLAYEIHVPALLPTS